MKYKQDVNVTPANAGGVFIGPDRSADPVNGFGNA